MRRLLWLLVGLGIGAAPAAAQTPATYESITVGSTAVGLSATTYQPSGQAPMAVCLVRLEVAEVRYRVDRVAPTASEGMLLEPGEALPLLDPVELTGIQFIRTGGVSGVAKVTCWRTPRELTFEANSLGSIGGTAIPSAGVAGALPIAGAQANNVAPTANPVQFAGYAWTDGTAPTATAAGNVTRLLVTTDGRLVTTSDHPKRFSCTVVNSTATTLTALGGACAAPGAGLSLYVTDINFSVSAASTTTADQQPELKSGTGGACGTGTAVVWNQFAAANAPVIAQFITPIKIAANNELCWMMAAAGNKSVTANGYIAP